MGFAHEPVLLDKVLSLLSPRPDGCYVDCTVGGGGHARAILERLGPGGRLIGLDQDEEALRAARSRLLGPARSEGVDSGPASDPAAVVTLLQANFAQVARVLDRLGVERSDGFLYDLGVSSHQLDTAERGFSYQQDAPLDMRMNPGEQTTSAYHLVNGLTEAELARLIWEYGEERWAKRIAYFIVKRRENRNIETTGELVAAIKAAIPAGARREGPHPAKRTFQALRIAVNDELGALERSLEQAVWRLAPGGRICVISFHSLEDRVVKRLFRQWEKGCVCPPRVPVCRCGKRQLVRLITRRPIAPSPDEVAANPRARSAKLRAVEALADR